MKPLKSLKKTISSRVGSATFINAQTGSSFQTNMRTSMNSRIRPNTGTNETVRPETAGPFQNMNKILSLEKYRNSKT